MMDDRTGQFYCRTKFANFCLTYNRHNLL